MKTRIHALFLEYYNDFLTVEGFASYYGVSPSRAASCVTLETEVEDLLEELISGALDQCAMLEREDA